jgi:hypothetical protein
LTRSAILCLELDEVERTFGCRRPGVLAGECGKLGERRQSNTQLFDGVGEGGDGLVDPVADTRSPSPRVLDRGPDHADEGSQAIAARRQPLDLR